MIDGSEKRNRQLAFELQNSHVCEKRSNDKKKLGRLDGSHSCRGQLDQNETIENSSFTYTANGKRQIQVKNFLK